MYRSVKNDNLLFFKKVMRSTIYWVLANIRHDEEELCFDKLADWHPQALQIRDSSGNLPIHVLDGGTN